MIYMMGTLIVGGIILLFVAVSVYSITHGSQNILHGCSGNCATCGACSTPDDEKSRKKQA